MALLDFKTACQKIAEPYSCFDKVTASEHGILPPKYLGSIPKGIRHIILAKQKTYREKLGGVIVAYGNAKVTCSAATIVADQPELHLSFVVDYVIFKPVVGTLLQGTVSKTAFDFVGLLVHDTFNASIFWRNSPKPDWAKMAAVGDKLFIKVRHLNTRGVLTLICDHVAEHTLHIAPEVVEADAAPREGKEKKKKKKHKSDREERKEKKKKKHKETRDHSPSNDNQAPTDNDVTCLNNSAASTNQTPPSKNRKRKHQDSITIKQERISDDDVEFTRTERSPDSGISIRAETDVEVCHVVPEKKRKKKKIKIEPA